jgi:2,3-bisphosphoglycerate-dependent phosphoglycerate mutase
VTVALKVRSSVWLVGTGDFLHAFFSTLSARLETRGWGSRFPVLLKELYYGELAGAHAAAALEELARAREELRRLPPSDVVWDVEDRSKAPPWGDDISPEITDLGNYFVTEDGVDLFAVLEAAIAFAGRKDAPLRIVTRA